MKRAPRVLLPLILAAALAACGGDAGRARDRAGVTEGAGVGSVPASEAAGQTDAAADTGGVRFYPLRLVNPRFYPIVVFASAGAREVLVDTVVARDSSRVNVQVAAGLLRLRALDLEGNELGVGFLSTWRDDPPGVVDSLSWELPPPP